MIMNSSLLLSISLWTARRKSYYLFNHQLLYAKWTVEWAGSWMLSHSSVLRQLKSDFFNFIFFYTSFYPPRGFMLKLAEHKPRRVGSVAPSSRAVIGNWVCDSILKGNSIDNAFYYLIKIFGGFTFCKGCLAKGFLELHVLLLCLAFMPYWIPLKAKQIPRLLGTSLTAPVSLSLRVRSKMPWSFVLAELGGK